ncbi:hypothetical protein J2W28_000311 [Variovorax boronicumulans]|uniref:hypothetical protein n=1 Tax=Variovorax boronicumulans TaxID=436515 RepID=UPI002783435F|nr:hypothetical protein [Variovorax boronicumulans]MDP9990308.1 hypothetical protein [Variovorax boronicumulans]MDQ0001183.1 hypothetical protein [Variovorax boronicumulans]
MNPATFSSPKKFLSALAAAVLAWASPGHCAPARNAWSGGDDGMGLVLLWLTAVFWVVTHVWTLLVVWAEARATRARELGAEAEKESA